MYNKEQKERFLKAESMSQSTEISFRNLFDATEKLENEWECDICCADSENLNKDIWKVLGLRSYSTISRKSMLERYARWCLNNEIPGATDNLTKIKSKSDAIRTKMVSSPLHLQRILDEMYEPEELEATSLIFRAFFWLAFSGLEEEEIIDIESDAIDLGNLVICYKDKKFPIYKESINTLRKCVELKDFYYKHPLYEPIRRERFVSKKLLRGIRSNPSKAIIRTGISRSVARYVEDGGSVRLSNFRVQLSGYFYRAYELERAGIEPDFRETAEEHAEKVNYSVSKNHSLNSRITDLERSLKKDYNKWKEAFSV